ncbi:hypothetical protein ABEB36_003083 [Hypothenemus hampei]|uniref:Uncharacterized protein n=1 Tax=Hypothenemus hampei TaxID=57062 RepID=A0ABD1FAL6_HYPHA
MKICFNPFSLQRHIKYNVRKLSKTLQDKFPAYKDKKICGTCRQRLAGLSDFNKQSDVIFYTQQPNLNEEIILEESDSESFCSQSTLYSQRTQNSDESYQPPSPKKSKYTDRFDLIEADETMLNQLKEKFNMPDTSPSEKSSL